MFIKGVRESDLKVDQHEQVEGKQQSRTLSTDLEEFDQKYCVPKKQMSAQCRIAKPIIAKGQKIRTRLVKLTKTGNRHIMIMRQEMELFQTDNYWRLCAVRTF